jgi:muramoyltetrapeptide carboxypeptidase
MKKQIYVCTPSAPFDGKRFQIDRSIANLNRLGFEVALSPHALDNEGNTSASIEKRLSDLTEGFTNDRYDIVMASRGGWNSNELLPHLDFELLKKHKKPFFGMSDMTTLCVNLFQKAGIPTVYGQLLLHFGLSDDLGIYKPFLDVVNELASSQMKEVTDIKGMKILKKGSMKGPLLGGNLAVLCWLLGTEYALQIPNETVLFLEDDEETNGFYWQMYLNHLKQAGVFHNISGIVFGKILLETQFEKGSSFENILENVFKEYEFPIGYEADFGHIDHPLPIVYGAQFKKGSA